MAMLRFLAISSMVMAGIQVFSSQELVVLTRGYGCYLNDPLRLAIQKRDCAAIVGLGSYLPVALEAQYGLLLLTDAPQVKDCVIALIKAEWESCMYSRPRAIETFCLEYARLLLPWSCCRGNVNRSFMIMLNELRAIMQSYYALNPAVLQSVACMPGLQQPRLLKSLIGMQIVAELKKRAEGCENFDRDAFLSSLPEDLRDIIVKYMTQPSSL
jgi:hypothetical protein